MKKVEYQGSIQTFVESYDKVDHTIWNATEGEIVHVRKHIREHYLSEQKYMCAYCRIEKKEDHGMTWDIEHILPKSLFPAFLFEPENLAIACKECNIPKGDNNILSNHKAKPSELPKCSKDYSVVHPHFDTYSDHFEITKVGNRRIYRALNNHKAKTTYIFCNLIRFDYQYSEWECFDDALVTEFSSFLDRCPSDATPNEIKRMLRHLKFTENADFKKI